MSARCWSLLACALLASGCGAKATQVIVILDAEPGVQFDSTQLHVVVQGGSGGTISAGGPLDELLTPGMGTPADPAYPFKLAIAPLGGDVSRSYSVTATALDGDTIVAQARIIGGYVEGEVVTVRLVLEDACVGVICGEGLTCKAHVCVDARTGEDADAGVRDAGLADGGLSGPDLGAAPDAGDDELGVPFDAGDNDLGTSLDAGPRDLGTGTDLGTACVPAVVMYVSGGYCGGGTMSCIAGCTDSACFWACLSADASPDCRVCVELNQVACANMHGCLTQYNAFNCCSQRECPTGSAAACPSTRCSSEWATYTTCAGAVLPTATCTLGYTACF